MQGQGTCIRASPRGVPLRVVPLARQRIARSEAECLCLTVHADTDYSSLHALTSGQRSPSQVGSFDTVLNVLIVLNVTMGRWVIYGGHP